MTTDTVPKVAAATVGSARIVGVAKGVGMIEPNMATLITLLFTDAELAADDLDADLPPGDRSHVQLRVDRYRHLHQRHGHHHGQRRCRTPSTSTRSSGRCTRSPCR